MDTLIHKNFIVGVLLTGMLFIIHISHASNTLFLTESQAADNSSVIIHESVNKIQTHVNDTTLSQLPDNLTVVNLFHALPSSIAIHWGDPTGKRLKVLTALECPYCAKQQSILKKLKTVHIEEYVVPQVDPYDRVDLKSTAVWCNSDRLSALNRAFNGELIPVFDECNTQSLLAVAEFINKYQLPVTPVFIKENGQVHTGFLSKQKLMQWLEEN